MRLTDTKAPDWKCIHGGMRIGCELCRCPWPGPVKKDAEPSIRAQSANSSRLWQVSKQRGRKAVEPVVELVPTDGVEWPERELGEGLFDQDPEDSPVVEDADVLEAECVDALEAEDEDALETQDEEVTYAGINV